MTNLICEVSIEINASKSRVWKALIDPEQIKKYLFGTHALSEWRVGSTILFTGEWEGKPYEDKGIILKMEDEKLLQYNYWSNFSGKADLPENYQTVTNYLTETNGKTVLRITQDNCSSEEAKNHSENNWKAVLTILKQILEE